MNNENSQEQKLLSVAAVRQYTEHSQANKDRHQAWVLTSEKEDAYPPVLYVYAEACNKSAKIIVEWNGLCGVDYPCEFTTSNSVFEYCSGILQIKSEDIFGKPISICLSEKS